MLYNEPWLNFQTKQNHSYNCRTEAQKLFAHHNIRSDGRPSCGSSWGGATEKASMLSRDTMVNSYVDVGGDPATGTQVRPSYFLYSSITACLCRNHSVHSG